MRIGVIGTRSLGRDISFYLPKGITEIVTAEFGIGPAAERWADEHHIPKLVIRSDDFTQLSKRRASQIIAETADILVAVWDGRSHAVRAALLLAVRRGKPVKEFIEHGAGIRYPLYDKSRMNSW